jgi:antitoxin HicB
MDRIMKLPLLLEPAEEGGWVVRSPVIPELITEIDHLDEIDEKIKDAVAAAKELYEDMREIKHLTPTFRAPYISYLFHDDIII